jgi:hypothetical protein
MNQLAMGILFAVAAFFFGAGLWTGEPEIIVVGCVVGGLCLVIGYACRPQEGHEAATHGSKTAIIKSATWNRQNCQLEMKVEAGHSRIVELDLPLPGGTWISAIKQNRLYLVEIPVEEQGNDMSDGDVYNTVIDLARSIGWTGKVGKA